MPTENDTQNDGEDEVLLCLKLIDLRSLHAFNHSFILGSRLISPLPGADYCPEKESHYHDSYRQLILCNEFISTLPKSSHHDAL